MTRVCYGEFDFPNGRTGRTAFLQNEFLKAKHRHAPQVWETLYDLRELFLPLISARLSRKVIGGKQPLRVRRKVILGIDTYDAQTLELLSKPQDYIATAAERLTAWAKQWNLNEEWFLQRAYDALQWWVRHGKVHEVLWAGANWVGQDGNQSRHNLLTDYLSTGRFSRLVKTILKPSV